MNKYLTEFKNKDGQAYGWHIMANSLEEAQKEVKNEENVTSYEKAKKLIEKERKSLEKSTK